MSQIVAYHCPWCGNVKLFMAAFVRTIPWCRHDGEDVETGERQPITEPPTKMELHGRLVITSEIGSR